MVVLQQLDPPRSAPTLPALGRPPPPRTAPARACGADLRDPPVGLHEWLAAIAPRCNESHVGTHVPLADLLQRTGASSHMPSFGEPLTRCTSNFALLFSGRPALLSPEGGLFDAMPQEALRPQTSTSYKLKPPLPTSHSTPALLRKVRKGPTGAERDGQGNEVAKATELSTSCTDNAGNLSNASRWGRRGASEPSPLHIASRDRQPEPRSSTLSRDVPARSRADSRPKLGATAVPTGLAQLDSRAAAHAAPERDIAQGVVQLLWLGQAGTVSLLAPSHSGAVRRHISRLSHAHAHTHAAAPVLRAHRS